jgi:hypothetical protein
MISDCGWALLRKSLCRMIGHFVLGDLLGEVLVSAGNDPDVK